jgi:hypothetical protein
LLVFGELDNGWKKGLRKKLDSDDCPVLDLLSKQSLIRRTVVNRLKFRDDVEADVGELVLQHLEEHGKEM